MILKLNMKDSFLSIITNLLTIHANIDRIHQSFLRIFLGPLRAPNDTRGVF